MRLIGVAFYERNLTGDLDGWKVYIWSPAIFGEMMATNNVVMQEDRQLASTRHLERQL